MKTLILILSLFITTNLYAAGESAYYEILKGKLHRGGSATVTVLPDPDNFVVDLSYKINKKALVPVPDKHLSGKTIVELPIQYRDERGYLELEEKGSVEIKKARLVYQKRVDVAQYKGAHQILILPSNGKSKTQIIYHPDAPALGWLRVKVIFVSDISLLNGYEAEMRLKEY